MTFRSIISSLLFALFVVLSGTTKVEADPTPAPRVTAASSIAPMLGDAQAETKAASASDEKAKSLGVQKGAETDSYNVKKAAQEASQIALTAAYNQTCPQGYPAERKAQCDQVYQTYVTNYNNARDTFSANVFAPSLQRWNALDAQQKMEQANAEKQRAAAQRALSVLSKFFPACAIGATTEALEATVDCMRQAWDGGGHHDPLGAVNGNGTPFFWNDANAAVKKYHDQFNAYQKAQSADEALQQTLQNQPSGPDRDMRLYTVQQRMSGRTNKMAYLKYQASQAAKQ